MKTLKLFYKESIKQISKEIRLQKKELKKAQRTKEISLASELQWKRVALKEKARYTFLAYAQNRGRSLTLVEKNELNPHSSKKLNQMLDEMEKLYQAELALNLSVSL